MKSLLIFKTYLTAFLICFIFISTNNSSAQNGWVQTYNNPSVNLTKICFVNNSTGWIKTDSNKILKTTDGGFSWIIQTVQNVNPRGFLLDMCFINENTGWLAGGIFETWGSPVNRMLVFKTTDGGFNWVKILDDGDNYNVLRIIHFSDINTGVAFGGGGTGSGTTGVMRRTTNGGLNWTMIHSDIEAAKIINDISGNLHIVSFFGDDIGRDTTYYHVSTNNGATWELKSRFSKMGFITDFDKMPDNSFLMITKCDTISFRTVYLKSTNQGSNWSMTVLDSGFNPSRITYVNSLTGWLTTNTSTLKTTNGGVSWLVNFSSYMNLFMFDSLRGLGTVSGGKIYITGTGGIVNINYQTLETPDKFSLSQNYPNPFNPTTNINYELPVAGYVQLKVYDVIGNEVKTLMNEKQNAGSYSVNFNAASLPSGIYFYKLVTENFSDTKKMILVK